MSICTHRFVEAALSKSLCFHFSDGTARARDLMRQFFVEAMGDVRWLQLFTDASNEVRFVRSLLIGETGTEGLGRNNLLIRVPLLSV